MRLEELKNEFPDIPDFVHDMIREEVEKQISVSNSIRMRKKKKFNRRMSRVAAAIVIVCIAATLTIAYAGTRLYYMHLEKQGRYGALTNIKADDIAIGEEIQEEVYEISITSNYIPKGMEWETNGYKLKYKDAPDTEGITIRTVLLDDKSINKSVLDKNAVESENLVITEKNEKNQNSRYDYMEHREELKKANRFKEFVVEIYI